MTDFRQEPFAQDVAFVIQNVPMLKAHIERRLARMYNVSALNEDYDRGKRQRTATNCAMFPGAIVCSLLRSDIRALTDSKNNYVALEKTDGVRYLLLLTTLEKIPYAILIDRKMEMRIVNLDFPLALFEQEALFDGELAQNIENGLFTFLIFDLIYTGVRGQNGEKLYKDTPYTQRMRQANHIVKTMWQKRVTTDAEYRVYSAAERPPPNTFSLKVKRYVPLNDFNETFKQVVEQNVWTHHGFRIDGFIFVRSRQHVEPFRNEEQFKYKPAYLHTIDVQLFRTRDNSFDLLIKNTRNCPQLYTKLTMCPENVTFVTQNQAEITRCEQSKLNFIVECCWSNEHQCWILKMPRFDKQTPNALNTVEQTKKNIQEDIKLEELAQRFRTTSLPSLQTQEPQQPQQPFQAPHQQPSQKGHFIHPSRLQNIEKSSAEYDPVQNVTCTKKRDVKAVCEHELSSIYSSQTINECKCLHCVPQNVETPTFNLDDLERLLFKAKTGALKL